MIRATLCAALCALLLAGHAAARPLPRKWLRGALCVHRHEAAWTNPGVTWDGRPSRYYGGMQFDLPTWNANRRGHFGAWPHKATPTAQLRVAFWTWLARGWHPWPKTARTCGLL